MKTRILSFLIMALGLMVSTSAFAQPLTPTGSSKIATAVDGSTVVYSVTDLSTADVKYVWKLSGGSTSIDGAAYTAGTNLEKIIGTDDPAYSVSINWNDAAPNTTYYLDVYVIDATGCYSEMKRTEITIDSQTIDLDAGQVATICSWLPDQDVTGNSDSDLDQVVLDFTTNGGISPVDITYTITCAALSVSETVTVNNVALTSATTGKLTVVITNKFENTSGSDKVFLIEITSATDDSGNAMLTPGDITSSITVHSVPVINF